MAPTEPQNTTLNFAINKVLLTELRSSNDVVLVHIWLITEGRSTTFLLFIFGRSGVIGPVLRNTILSQQQLNTLI